jgi:hypothetical protein
VDTKERDLIGHWHSRISRGLFDEKDTYAFLILLRPYTAAGSPAREFADFVAHRRRDRGAMLDFISRYSSAPANDARSVVERVAAISQHLRTSEVLCSVEQLRESLNESLNRVGVQPLDTKTAKDLTFTIIALLQNARLEDRQGDNAGSLMLAFNADVVMLLAVRARRDGTTSELIPVLRVANRYIRYRQMDQNQFMTTPNDYITVFNRNGELRAYSE